MASRLLVFLLFSFITFLFILPSFGRNLQKVYNDEMVASIKVQTVSHATNTYTGKTNYSDVLGLIALTDAFPSLAEANDDPCLTPQWTWIECNSDPSPRIIALDLNSKLLFGFLPDFSSMDALLRIDLSQNSLVGTIPEFLGTFPHLQELNIAFNLFYGLIPDSIACDKNLKLYITGNSGLYTSNACSISNGKSSPNPSVPSTVNNNNNDGFVYTTQTYSTKKKSKVGVIVGVSVPLFLILWIAVGIFALFRHKAKTAAAIAAASAPVPVPGPNETPIAPECSPAMASEERPINPHH